MQNFTYHLIGLLPQAIYIDDVDALIQLETTSMKESYKNSLITATFPIIIILLSIFAVLIFFENKIRELLLDYEGIIKRSNDDLIKEHEKTIKALAEVKQLKSMLPICSLCKKIRDDQGYYNQLETYMKTHTDISFTHGYCPECYKNELEKIQLLPKNRQEK